MTFKELKEKIESVGQIANREALQEAVPLIVESMERMKSMSQTMKNLGKVAGKLNDRVSKYALEHPTIFNDGLTTDEKGVVSGDITIGGDDYHFAAGYADPKRTDGDAMSQDFLEGLPKEWTQSMLKLSTGGINRCGATIEDLASKGLYRPAKNEWSKRVSENLIEIG